jgi:hypothetical protein
VLHTASPFPGHQPADENELILPARDGTLRVLTVARRVQDLANGFIGNVRQRRLAQRPT